MTIETFDILIRGQHIDSFLISPTDNSTSSAIMMTLVPTGSCIASYDHIDYRSFAEYMIAQLNAGGLPQSCRAELAYAKDLLGFNGIEFAFGGVLGPDFCLTVYLAHHGPGSCFVNISYETGHWGGPIDAAIFRQAAKCAAAAAGEYIMEPSHYPSAGNMAEQMTENTRFIASFARL